MFDPFKEPAGPVQSRPFGTTSDGREVTLFQIPNSTEDYIEVINYGCTIKSLFIHDWSRRNYINMLCGLPTLAGYEAGHDELGAFTGGPIGGGLPDLFSHKVWAVEEVGTNYVFLSCRAEKGEGGLPSGLTVGAKIQWVNLNRLVVDLFATPDQAMALDFTLNLLFSPNGDTFDGYALRSFSPWIARGNNVSTVSDTPYAQQSFVPVTDDTLETFVDRADEIHPAAELTAAPPRISISAYTTQSAMEISAVSSPAKAIRFNAQTYSGASHPVPLTEGGETWSARIIYGFDSIPAPEVDMDPASNLLPVFCG